MDAMATARALRDPQVQRMADVAARAEREAMATAWLQRQMDAQAATEFAEAVQRVTVDHVPARPRPAAVAARVRRKRKLAAIARRKSRR